MKNVTYFFQQLRCVSSVAGTFLLAMLLMAASVSATDYTSSSFIVRDPTLNVGGGRSSSASFQEISSTGQTAIGPSTGTLFQTQSGFLYFSVSTLTQATFRWFANTDALQPTSGAAGENTAVTSVATNDVLRLRLAVRASGEPFPKNTSFKLQYAELGSAPTCASIPSGSFADVGASGSAAVWRGFDNPSVTSGATVSANLLSTASAGAKESYEENGVSASSPAVITVDPNNDNVEWDWVVQNNGASASTAYCFRQVLTSGGTLNAYDVFPALTTTGTTPPPPPPPPSSGQGSSGGPTSTGPTGAQVIFRGKAYPSSLVTILKDGQTAVSTPASPDANFDITVSSLSPGTYTFGVSSQDVHGTRSITQTFTIAVTDSTTTVVSGIFLPPTIEVDQDVVKRGDPLGILGQSVPSATITIVVNSTTELMKQTAADTSGLWFYKLDTLELENGDHTTKARAKTAADISSFSPTVVFQVGNVSLPPTKVLKGDLNKDGHVNLVDFSIAAYWYRRILSAAFAPIEVERLNGDGKVDLTDFSIMAYYWTG